MATEHLLVATGICLLVERDPITTAKEVASLDHVSGGRFLFGVGRLGAVVLEVQTEVSSAGEAEPGRYGRQVLA
jgi:alkanesulfonate monooxygenase SsuD/methylene tetrahydromethanopterin reductase-like flavin-dependent oxidoreductase (luciferase family)